MFWNVAGVRNKDRAFWKGLEKWEVMVLPETWLKEKEWGKMKRKLPKGYIWGIQWANRKSTKRRAIGGIKRTLCGLVRLGAGLAARWFPQIG